MQNDKMSAFKKLKGAKLTLDDMKEVRERARVEYDALTEEARCDRLSVQGRTVGAAGRHWFPSCIAALAKRSRRGSMRAHVH